MNDIEGVVRDRAKFNRATRLTGNDIDPALTEEEKCKYSELVEVERALDRELLDLRNQEKEFRSTAETLDLLHEYNDIRDATQVLMGAIAVAEGTTVRNLYRRYGLSAKEDE